MMSPGRTRYEAFTVRPLTRTPSASITFCKHLPRIVGEPAGQVRIDPLAVDARLDFKFQGRFGKRRGPHVVDFSSS